MISAVESVIGALSGAALGFGVFFLLRPALTNLNFTGEPFARGDLSLSLVDTLLVMIGVPAAAALAARIAMRRVDISPLGVSRRVNPPMPRAYRVVPLIAGIAELGYFADVGSPKGTGAQILAYFSGCFLIMAGLVMAGPWLTMVGSRYMVGRTSGPAALLAGRRISDNPRAAFRSISGLIIALFATSVSVGIITTILADGPSNAGSAGASTLLEQFRSLIGPNGFARGPSETPAPVVPDAVLKDLRSIPRIQGVALIYAQPDAAQNQGGGLTTLLASCTQLAHTPAVGRCPPGAAVAATPGSLDVNPFNVTKRKALASTVWPAAPVSLAKLSALRLDTLVVESSGSSAAVEAARTTLEVAFPDQNYPETLNEINGTSERTIAELRQMTNVVIAASLVIAGCSLAVSVTGGVSDRKRPFSLLRLTGVPLRVLRRVVALEAAVPLIAISVLSAAAGFFAAGLFLNAQLGDTLRPPEVDYYVLVAAGLAASLAIIGATLPLISRITGPEIARNE